MKVSLAVAAAALVESSAPALAQVQRVVIDSRVTCPTCRITLGTPIQYGADDDPGIIPGDLGSIARDARGNVWVASGKPEGAPVVFTPSGQPLKPIARKGDGPGEMRGQLVIAPTLTDTVYVIDLANGRASVATATGGVARQVTLPRPVSMHALALTGGSLVLGGSYGGGIPRLIGAKGEVVRTLGYASRSRNGAPPIARSSAGGIWSARPTAYVIERYDSLGRKDLQVERRADWFKAYDETTPWETGMEPQPAIIDLHEDDAGRLWVVSKIAGENWRAALGGTRTVGNRTVRDIKDYGLYFDIMYEVLDPKTGELLFSSRDVPGIGRTLEPGGWAIIPGSLDDGRMKIAPLILAR